MTFQSVMEECGPNHMTRRLDKAQQQQEITLEHMETTLQAVQNHQVNMNIALTRAINNKLVYFNRGVFCFSIVIYLVHTAFNYLFTYLFI